MHADGIISDNLFVFTHLTSFYCARCTKIVSIVLQTVRPVFSEGFTETLGSGICFYPRDAMLVRCLCLSQVGVLLKRLNDSSWFLHGNFLRPILLCVTMTFRYLQKLLSLELCS